MHNDKIVPRPDNTTYSNDLYADTMVDQIKKFQNDDIPEYNTMKLLMEKKLTTLWENH